MAPCSKEQENTETNICEIWGAQSFFTLGGDAFAIGHVNVQVARSFSLISTNQLAVFLTEC